MHEYDGALKLLLQASKDSIIRRLTGVSIMQWLNVEIAQVQTSRVDLLGATASGALVHVELQSSNDPAMALRMAEYALRIYREFGKIPKQIVLYVGDAPIRMRESLDEPSFPFRYTLMDIRELSASSLLESGHIEDNLLAILGRLEDQRDTVRQILTRIANLEEPDRRDAFTQFLIISGLRRLAPAVKEEAQKMPILNDILDHEVIGPAILQGLEQGRQQGIQEGRKEGRKQGHQEGLQEGLQEGKQQGIQQGRQEVLRHLLEKKFGTLPAWVAPRLSELSASELDELAVRLLNGSHLEELFPAKH